MLEHPVGLATVQQDSPERGAHICATVIQGTHPNLVWRPGGIMTVVSQDGIYLQAFKAAA